MRHYYCRCSGFVNVYHLYFIDDDDPDYETLRADAERWGCVRIPYKTALQRCVAERRRRREDPTNAGYATAIITPYRAYYRGLIAPDHDFMQFGTRINAYIYDISDGMINKLLV